MEGSCPDNLGQGADGVGAEVEWGCTTGTAGYRRHSGGPDYQHKQTLEFSLVNPRNNGEMFSASSGATIWWLHKWMKYPNYDQYASTSERSRNDSRVHLTLSD